MTEEHSGVPVHVKFREFNVYGYTSMFFEKWEQNIEVYPYKFNSKKVASMGTPACMF